METEPTIHIVEDDGAVRRSLECLLHAAGFKSMAYKTALSFLDAAPEVSAGCVLLDVRMPEMDGLELQARLNRLGCPLPVIVMTGGGEVEDAVRAMKAGAVDFIEKPFDDERLFGAIEEALTMSGRSTRNRETAEAAERIGTLSRRERQVLDALSAGRPSRCTVPGCWSGWVCAASRRLFGWRCWRHWHPPTHRPAIPAADVAGRLP
jgi:two-component system response regulator FixJ